MVQYITLIKVSASSEWLDEEDPVLQRLLLSNLHSMVTAPVFMSVKNILMVEMLLQAVLLLSVTSFSTQAFFCFSSLFEEVKYLKPVSNSKSFDSGSEKNKWYQFKICLRNI